MWNWIKSAFKDFEAAQQELAKENIFFISSWHGMIFYVIPEYEKKHEQNKKDTVV